MAEKGKRRRYYENEPNTRDVSSDILAVFSSYRQELDSRHDKHERIVKLSRDVTIESKRVIFLLHRCISEEKSAILAEAEEKLRYIRENLFKHIAKELRDEDPYRYLKAYYHGLQEYVEAVTFYDYITHTNLITDWINLESHLTFPSSDEDESKKDCVTIPPTEYMLGVLDMTGELMRMCISMVGGGDRSTPFSLCQFARSLQRGFDSVDWSPFRPHQKLRVMRQSVGKMENVCYQIVVRGEELPPDRLLNTLNNRDNQDVAERETD